MKHLFRDLIFVAFLSLPSLLSADTLSLSTYYPAPFGSYSMLRLTPQTDASMGVCDTSKTGVFYLSSDTGDLKICSGTSWGATGPWTVNSVGKIVYLTSSVTDPAYKTGIGDLAPDARFHVKGEDNNIEGQLKIESTQTEAKITLVNSSGATDVGTGGIVMSNAAGLEGLTLQINNSDVITIDESQDVGIGVTTPTAKLHVMGINGAPYGQLKIDSTDGDAKMTLNALGGIRGSLMVSNTAGSEGLQFLTYDTTRMILDENGNLGIGLIAPTARLHVARTSATGTVNTATFDNINLIDENQAAYTSNALCAGTNCASTDTNFMGVRMYSSTALTNTLTLGVPTAGGSSSIAMQVGSTAQLVATPTAVTTDTSVNVGIGIPAPTYKLHVSGPIGGNLDSANPGASGELKVDCASSPGNCYALYAP